MGPSEHSTPEKVRCIMCNKSVENTITGPLSTKQDISAHQNCLLYSSGLICKFSPSFDDLFGFDVDDVKTEHKRGRKLSCHYCKEKGATVGCETSSCKRSYHYPCTKKDHARSVEDMCKEIYKVYCERHDPQRSSANSTNSASETPRSTPGSKRSRPNHTRGETSSELKFSHQRGRRKGRAVRQAGLNKANSRQLLSKSDSGTPTRTSSRKRKLPIVISSDSDDCDLIFPPLDSNLKEGTPSKQQKASTPIPKVESRDQGEPSSAVSGVAPLSNGDTNGDGDANANGDGNGDGDGDDTDIDMNAASPSLLPSEFKHEQVSFNVIVDSGPSIESENSFEPCSPCAPGPAAVVSNSQGSVSGPECAVHTDGTTPLNPPKPSQPSPDCPPVCDVAAKAAESPERSSPATPSCKDFGPVNSPTHSASGERPSLHLSNDLPKHQITIHHNHPLDLTSPPGASTESAQPSEGPAETAMSEASSALFWRRCNDVGCTETIFTELTRQVSSLAERVQNGLATQQEYAVSLRILEASGKLPLIFKRLEQDFEEQERELQEKREALKDAKSALNYLS